MRLDALPEDVLSLIARFVLEQDARELEWMQTPSQLDASIHLGPLSLTSSRLRQACLPKIFGAIDLPSTISLRQAKVFFETRPHLCGHVVSLRYRRYGAKHAESLRQLLTIFVNLRHLLLRNTFGDLGDLEGLEIALDSLEINEPYPIALPTHRLDVLLRLVTGCQPRKISFQFRHQPVELILPETSRVPSVRSLHLSLGFFNSKSILGWILWMPNIENLTIIYYDGGPFVPRSSDIALAEVLAPIAGQLHKLHFRSGNFFQRIVAPTSPFRLHALSPALSVLEDLTLESFFLSVEGINNLPATLRRLCLIKMSLPLNVLVDKIERDLSQMRSLHLASVTDVEEGLEAEHAARLIDICGRANIDLHYTSHSSALPFFFPEEAD